MRLLAWLPVLLLCAAATPAVYGVRVLHQDGEAPDADSAVTSTMANATELASVPIASTTADTPSIAAEEPTTATAATQQLGAEDGEASTPAKAATTPLQAGTAGDAPTEQLPGTPPTESVQAATTASKRAARRHRRRSNHTVTAAATCNWPGHCLGDPCSTANDCAGTMICINRKCAAVPGCSWIGHCLGDPCRTNNDCDGALICSNGKCGTSSPSPPPRSSPSPRPPSPPPVPSGGGQGQCPAGWYEASLTVYDAWPYPNSAEWASYSGGQYLGQFAYKSTSAGCKQPGEVYLNSWSAGGRTGAFSGDCHWRHDWVAANKVASVFKASGSPVNLNFNTQIAGKQILVASVAAAKANPTSAGVLVLAADTCGDSDCNNCCTQNASPSPSKMLIDLEKNAMKAVFPGISGFVPTTATYSNSRVTYQGSSFDVSSISGFPSTVCFRLP